MRAISLSAILGLAIMLLMEPASAQTRGGTAVFAVGQDPQTVNPDVSINLPDQLVGCITYEGLVGVSPDYRIVPQLAKSWGVSPDGLTYTLDLADARWHDGRPVTSEDVRYTLQEVSAKYSPVFTPTGRVIEAIDTPTPGRVVVRLKESYGPFLISLGCAMGGAILPSHLMKGTDPLKNPATLTQPVGTGPFKLAEWKRGDYIRLTRNPEYREAGKPYLDEVVAKVITRASAQMQALRGGEIDLAHGVAGNDSASVRADPKLKIEFSDTAPGVNLLVMNVTRKPLDDKRVRHALFMATDRDYIFKTIFFSEGGVGLKPYTSDIPWAANPEVDFSRMYPFSADRANGLLDEAGLKRGPDGKRLTLHISVYATQHADFQQVAVALRSMWQAVGVDLVVDTLEDATLIKKVFVDRDFDLTINSANSFSDPALGLARAFVSTTIGKPFGNASGYANPEVDALFDQGARATDLAERSRYYRQVQVVLAEDLPSPMIRQYRNLDAATARLKGLWGNIQGTGDWANAWLEP